ncbi:MAG: DUF790 family protein [Candidatus Poribacteria bacterium]|nr:DUF790 family protein [Candidatus Poribacteria bacterium]
MLTKDLIRYKIFHDTITPEFIDPDDPTLLAVAEQLLGVFEESQGKTREELLQESKGIIESAPCAAIIVRGLEKLLLDRTQFDTEPDEQLLQFRASLFERTSQLLQKETFSSSDEYQQRVGLEFQKSPEALAAELYSDLPAYQPVIEFKPLSAKRLLHRYNCALVQGLLFHCEKLMLKISDAKTESLRQLFKYLRFRQLLATIQKDREGHFWISVDGPLNLFYQTKKYGINLANFFVAVLHQPKWELKAEIQLKNQKHYHLSLSESCGILPDSPHFWSYIPQEIQLFQTLFHRQAEAWQIAPAHRFVPLEGEFYCFPDYTLMHANGIDISMELFHPWHASHLTVRLQQLEGRKSPLLILGVSRVLLKNQLVAQSLEASDYFSRYGFVFRQIPTMVKVLPVLDRILAWETLPEDGARENALPASASEI